MERELLPAVMSAHQYDELSPEASAQINAAFGRLLALFEEVVAAEGKERHFSDFDLRPPCAQCSRWYFPPPCAVIGWAWVRKFPTNA